MKKIILGLVLLVGTGAMAQKNNTTSAAVAFKSAFQAKMSGDAEAAFTEMKEAKEYIDKAIVHEDTKNDPKTLMYQGKIYIECAFLSAMVEGENTTMDAENLMKEGFAAFDKSRENDSKERYTEDIETYCNTYRSVLANMGIDLYSEEKWLEASGALLGAAQFGEGMNVVDSVYYFYGGIAAFNIDSLDIAKEAFEKTYEVGYEVGSSVSYLSKIYQSKGEQAKADKLFTEAVEKYPKNLGILIEKINFLIDTDRKEEAVTALEKAIELDPTNAALYYSAASVYQNIGNFEKAEASFLKVLELDPDNVDAAFGLGGLYFNKGADLNNEANTMDLSDPNYQKTLDNSKAYFEKAVPYLEKAHESAPKDLVILESLKQVYGKLQMVDKFKEAKAKIAELQAE